MIRKKFYSDDVFADIHENVRLRWNSRVTGGQRRLDGPRRR